jgi:hypothetical protein
LSPLPSGITSMSADEARPPYIELMGDPLGTLFHHLWHEVASLHVKWEEYVELFGTKPSRIEILNSSSPMFFRLVQDTIWDATLLHIARLTDPPKSKGKENLTIQGLRELITDPTALDKVSGLIEIAMGASTFCRDWRNRKIAHSDLKLATDETVKPLAPASRKQVTDAIKAISEVLNAVGWHYTGSTTIFDIGGMGGAGQLLAVLHDGLKAKTERRERRRRGEYREDDCRPVDL